jgi:hypothetical protein
MNPEDSIPVEVRDRVEYGLYGGVEQFFVNGVDGTCAELGPKVRDWTPDQWRRVIARSDRSHRELMESQR